MLVRPFIEFGRPGHRPHKQPTQQTQNEGFHSATMSRLINDALMAQSITCPIHSIPWQGKDDEAFSRFVQEIEK